MTTEVCRVHILWIFQITKITRAKSPIQNCLRGGFRERAKATQNLRIQDDMPVFDGQQVIIDGATSARYEGVCGKCYLKLKRGKR